MSPPWILPSRLFRLCEASVVTARDALATEADPTMSPNKRNKAQARNGILSRYLKFFLQKPSTERLLSETVFEHVFGRGGMNNF